MSQVPDALLWQYVPPVKLINVVRLRNDQESPHPETPVACGVPFEVKSTAPKLRMIRSGADAVTSVSVRLLLTLAPLVWMLPLSTIGGVAAASLAQRHSAITRIARI